MNTTNSHEEMIGLGVNPGLVSHYSDLSDTPVSFSPGSNLGWGQEWVAMHSAIWNIWKGTDKEQILVDGQTITIEHGKNESFMALLTEWHKKMNGEYSNEI